jgi:formylglycine-generating enzyme required for sulfatase activity
MDLTGNINTLSRQVQSTLRKLNREKGYVITRFPASITGEGLLVLDATSITSGSQVPHIVKLLRTDLRREEQSHYLDAKQTNLADHIPTLIDVASEGSITALLYQIPNGHLNDIVPFDYLLKTDVGRATEYSREIANILKQWNYPSQLYLNQHTSLTYQLLRTLVNLGQEGLYGRWNILERTEELAPNLDKATSLIFEGTDSRLPNPIAYVYQSGLWRESHLTWAAGYLHGNLSTENIICDLRGANPMFIEWDLFEERALTLYDFANLELDLLLHYLPHSNLEEWMDWLEISTHLSHSIVPVGAIRGQWTRMALALIQPLREQIESISQSLSSDNREWFETSFWLATVAASLRLIRKRALKLTDRAVILLYGAHCLKRLLSRLHLTDLTSTSANVAFPRNPTNINWEAVGLISREAKTPKAKPFDIFLSYAHEDRDWVERIAQDLRAAGYTVFLDTASLRGGDEWISTITSSINTAPVFITLVSSAGNASIWVKREFLYAEGKKKLILPVQIQECVLPIYVLERQVIKMYKHYNDGLGKLLAAIPRSIKRTGSDTPVKTRRRLLEQAYLDRMLFKFSIWRDFYTPMAGTSERRSRVLDIVTPSAMNPLFQLLEERRQQLDIERPQHIYNVADITSEILARKRVVLLGEPGAGKSTTLWNLVAHLAAAAQMDEQVSLPLIVPLGGYIGNESIIEYISNYTAPQMGKLAPFLSELLQENRIMLMLDGLNEMPRLDYKQRVQKIAEFIYAHPQLPVVVSCRELDYTVDLRMDSIRIAPLDPIRIHAFLRSYLKDEGDDLFWKLIGERIRTRFWERFRQGGGNDYDFWLAKDEPAKLKPPWLGQDWQYWLRVRADPRSYMALARNPYMLFVLTQIYAQEHNLPSNRGQLFRLFIDVLITREQNRIDPGNWIDSSLQCLNLSKLAFALQQGGQQGTSVDYTTALTYLGSEALIRLAASENILEVGDRIRFSHQLLQEFFAALALDEERHASRQATDFWPGPQWWKPSGWEETSVIMAGLHVDDPDPVLDWISSANPELAARCIASAGIRVEESKRQSFTAKLLPRITDLAEEIGSRAAIGRAMGMIDSDPRPGVCSILDGIPVVEWCNVPSGPFIKGVGDESRVVDLYSYSISKYLVTNAQFQAFVVAGGYTQEWRHCWTNAGWLNKRDRLGPPQFISPFTISNHPRIGITWYEAVAFSRWLNERMLEKGLIPAGFEVRLPTEAEWEKAARGVDGRAYPWDNHFDWNKCNANNLDSTSTVGIFPDGASPFGVMDMIGNAWKWCLTKWSENPLLPENNSLEGETPRVYRGGSWGINNWRSEPWDVTKLHCGNRYWNEPEDRRPDAVSFFLVMGPEFGM